MEKLNKCPACGALRTSFAAVCPECGYEYNDVEVSSTIQNFVAQISKYDEEIAYDEGSETKKKSGWVKFGLVLLWIYAFPIMVGYYIMKMMASKDQSTFKGAQKLKANAISTFPIPNNRNDLLETAIMMEGQIKKVPTTAILSSNGLNLQAWNEIWLAKFGNIVKKAEIALKDDSKSLNQIKTYYSNSEAIVKANSKLRWTFIGALGGLFVVFLIILIAFR